MPWKETHIVDQRKDFVLKAFEKKVNFTELCKQYGISTKTGYKWKERFIKGGFPGLVDQRKTPKTSPFRLNEEMTLEFIKLKIKKKTWGAKKILEIFQRKNPHSKLPHRTTLERLFQKAGLTQQFKKRRVRHNGERISNREKALRPNHIWTVDFKGWWYTPEKEKCNPLTVRDEYSKYILSIKALQKGDITSVKAEFERIFKIHGIPEIIKSDNGPPFASHNSLLGLTKLSAWWVSLGIRLDRIEPGKPYQNGAHERMHLDMKRELENQIDGNLTLHQKRFEKWRIEFNKERPHEALHMKTPYEVYQKSEKIYDPEDVTFEYPRGFKSRNVNDRGYINWRGQRIMIGNPVAGYNVGVKKSKDEKLSVYLAETNLGIIDENLCLLLSHDDAFSKK